MKKAAESVAFGVYKVYTRIKQSIIKHFDRGQHIAQDVISTVRKKAISSRIGSLYGNMIARVLEGSVESVDVFLKKIPAETQKRVVVDLMSCYQQIALAVGTFVDEHQEDFKVIGDAANEAGKAFTDHVEAYGPELEAAMDTIAKDLTGLGERIKRYTKKEEKPTPKATKKTTTAKKRSTKKEKAKSEATSGSNDPVS